MEITEPPFCYAKNLRSSRVRHAPKQTDLNESSTYLTPLNNMPRRTTPGTSAFSLDITHEAKRRFATIHESLGYKTKTETFEAIVYEASTRDKIDPHALERIERMLQNLMEHLSDFA